MEQTFIEEESSKGFDIKRYFLKLGKNYLWFIIAISFFCAAAYFYLRYTLPLYEVTTSILIKQPNEVADKLGSPFEASSGGESNGTDINTEIFKLRSASVVGEVVDSLKLDLRFGIKENDKFKPVSVEALPFTIQIIKSDPENESPNYNLTFTPAGYKLESESVTINGKLNEPVVVGSDTLILQPKGSATINKNAEYEFQYLGRTKTVKTYIARLDIGVAPKAGAGMLQVKMHDEIAERAKKFIAVLVYSYDVLNLDYNNQALRKEMQFLNERLAAASAELEQQAKMVRDFKAGNQIFDVSSSANQLLSTLPLIDNKRSDNMLKEDLLNLVENNIKSYNGHEEIVPNSSGLQDPVLADQINKYNQLVLQKRTVLDNGTAQDPRLPSINGQMQEIRGNILKNVRNIRSEIRANSNALAMQERTITGRFSSIPAKEKELVEMNRLLDIKQSLYTFLLQKREDKNMELASSEIAESRIIDDGLGGASKFPSPKIVYAIALGIGILIPALIILVQYLMNDKVETRQDVEALTSIPIAGEIGNVQKRNMEIVITPENVSSEAEQFRTLRANISYLLKGLSHKVLLITSSKSGEGKSFVSLNLANSIAISNKKVALLEFDLRDPGLGGKLGIESSLGLANYLNDEVEIEDIIQPSNNSENLFFISCGDPLPKNPGELILSDKMGKLFAFLKENFDTIIIDTPPVGPVSDAITLGKWADISFFVIRHKHTLRSTMKLINKLNDEKKLPRLTLIINGIKDNKEFSYGNDFGYGYGYQATDKKKKKALIG